MKCSTTYDEKNNVLEIDEKDSFSENLDFKTEGFFVLSSSQVLPRFRDCHPNFFRKLPSEKGYVFFCIQEFSVALIT